MSNKKRIKNPTVKRSSTAKKQSVLSDTKSIIDVIFHEPVVCFIDIECSPSTGLYWSQPWQTRIIHEIESFRLFSFAAKFQGEEKIICKALPDYPTWHTDPKSDRLLCIDILKCLERVDIACAHNIKFDLSKINARCLVNGLPCPNPYIQQYDTLRAVKRVAGFIDNRLSALATYLDLPAKLDSGGIETTLDILYGDTATAKAAFERLKVYNIGDVVTLEALHDRIASVDKNYPKKSYYNHSETCDVCGSKHLQPRGWKKGKHSLTRRLVCAGCGHWQMSKQNVRMEE